MLFINKVLNKDEKINKDKLQKIIDNITFEKLKEKEKKQGFPEAVTNNFNDKIN